MMVPIDTATDATGTPIDLPTAPERIAITPTATTAYVSSFSANTLTPVDLASGTARTPINLPASVGTADGVAITPDGSTALVTGGGSSTGGVVPVDLATGTTGIPVTLGNEPTGIAISPDGSTAYVADNDALDTIDLSTGTVTGSVAVGSGPLAVAINPSGTDVYVANTGGVTVSVISTATDTLAATITVGDAPDGLAVSPDGSTLYVTNNGDGTVSVISTATNSVTNTITVGAAPIGLAVTPDGSQVLVADTGVGQVSVIDAATNAVTNTFAVGGPLSLPVNIAITPDQAPHAALSSAAGAAGSPTTLDASASTAASGTVASYTWDFGDGSSATTSSPTASHTYATAGTFTASVTVTSSVGTSTTQVFTGQTVLRNGGPGATVSATVTVPAAPVPPGPAPPPVVPVPVPVPVVPVPPPPPPPVMPVTPVTPPTAPPAKPIVKPSIKQIAPPTPHKHHHPPNPLEAVPPAGTPGMAVSLTDRHLVDTCKPSHTVYVFFDNQLVTETQLNGHVFTDDTIVIPGSANPGEHHFELSCTDVDPWLATTYFHVENAVNHPMEWVLAVPHAGNITGGVSTWAKATAVSLGLLLLLLVYLLGFPAEWFNDTYDANEERILAAVRRHFPKLFEERTQEQKTQKARRRRRRLTVPLLFIAFVALAALIQCFLEPKFGLNNSSLWMFLGWCAGVAVVTLGFQLPAIVLGVRTERRSHRVRFRVLVGSIFVGIACVIVSRALALQPGYCYGLIAVFAFRPVLPEKISGRIAAISSIFVLLLSMAAWAVKIPVDHLASHPHPTPGILIFQAGLSVVFMLGIESVSFGMLPLPFLPGRDVAAWNRWAWAGVFTLGLVAFVWTLLQPGNGTAANVQHLDLVPVFVTCGAFAVLSLAFMGYFRYRKPKLASTANEGDAPVGLVG